MLAPFDQVSADELARMNELDLAQDNASRRLMELELDVVQTLAIGKRLREEQQGLFRKIGADRGIPQTARLDINPRTGEIEVTLESGEILRSKNPALP